MRKFSLFMLYCLTGLIASGQGAKYIVQNYSLMDELSLNGSVWSIVQDTNGVLFFGTDNGVVVYDGVYWDLVSLNQNAIRCLIMDNEYNMYYGGVNDFGLIKHDMTRGFYFSSLSENLPDSLRLFGDIWSINKCDNGVFFQSRNRIFILDSNEIHSYQVSDSYHRGFIIGHKYIINQKDIGLTFFDKDGFNLMPGGSFFKDKTISSLMVLPLGKILIGTRKNGVFQYNPLSGDITDPFVAYPATNDFLAHNQLYHGIVLPDGTMAFATLYYGTLIVSKEGRILKMLNRHHGLRDNVHYALGVSSDNNLWICTSNGISAFNTNSPFIFWDYTSGIDGVILDIQDFNDDIFIGSLTGLYKIPGGNTGRELYQTGITRLLDTEVWDIAGMSFGNKKYLFVGTGAGLYSSDGTEFHLEKQSGIVLKIIQLKNDPAFFLAMRSEDADLYQWNGSVFTCLTTISGIYSGLRTVAQDSKGYLWIGTRGSGIVRIPVHSLTSLPSANPSGHDVRITEPLPVRNFPFTSELTDVFEFEGNVIFSNNDGLLQYNYSTETFKRCFLFGPNVAGYKKMIISLDQDSYRNIWVGGEDLFLYHPDGTYSVDKLHFQQPKDIFSAFVFFHDDWCRTWIGGNNGVYLYDGQSETRFPSRLQTLLNRIVFDNDSSRLSINSSQLNTPGPDERVENGNYLLTISLTKRNSQVTFYYALPFFESENRTLYSYLLEGYSDDWSNWSDRTSVTFSNLKPARYTLKVRAKTIYEQISDPASVRFIVPQPWYTSRWAVILYFILLSLIVYLIAHRISVVKVRKQLRIEDIIQKRIQETKLASILSNLQVHEASATHQKSLETGQESALLSTLDQLPSGQAFLNKALKILENNMSDPDFGVIHFCQELGMSQAKVYRKLLSLTGMNITKFIRNIRLKKAAELLLETDLSISEVAYQTGFSNPGYFTKCFKGEFGKNPRDVAHNKKRIHL